MGSFRLKLVLYFALLALLPSAIAFYGFDKLARRTETSRVDARLQAGLRASLTGYATRLEDAQRRATVVAREPGLQHVLRTGTDEEIRSFVATRPLLLVVRGSRTFGQSPALAARRSVLAVAASITLCGVNAASRTPVGSSTGSVVSPR